MREIKMLELSAISVLCPYNDLESATILEIARRQNMDVHEIKGEWGLTLANALEQISNLNELKQNIITIELPPDPVSQQLLIQAGKKLISIDHHGEHWKPLSSLEQFADLINHKLTDKERHIAIADRDWLYGLSAEGVSFEDAQQLRTQEYEIQNKVDLIEEAKKEFEQYCHNFDDLRIILCPEKYRKTMLEVAQFPTSEKDYKENKIKPILILYHHDSNNKIITQIEFAGEASEKDWIEELIKSDWLQQDFTFWNGGGYYGCFFGAIPKPKLANNSIDKLISQILSCTLITGRPLSHYNCTFLLTFDGDWKVNEQYRCKIDPKLITYLTENDTSKITISKQIKNELASYLYLLPHLRNILIDTHRDQSNNDERVLRHYRLPKEILEKMSLILDGYQLIEQLSLIQENAEQLAIVSETNEEKTTFKVKIEDVSLFSLSKIYIFTMRVSPVYLRNGLKWRSDDQDWWHGLIYDNSDNKDNEDESHQQQVAQQMQIQTWLRFTKLARILYQSFSEQVFENKIANLTFEHDQEIKQFGKGYAFSPIIEHLINLFFNKNDFNEIKERLQETQTDRMYVNVAYGLAGIAPEMKIAKERYERLFSLALYVDEGTDSWKKMNGYVYDYEFTQNLMKQDMITRWKGLGVYSGYTIYSNTHFGSSWYFNNIIAPEHVPYIYGHMLVVGLFYQASLRYFAKKVSIATKKLASENTDHQQAQKEFRDLRKEFIVFTNDYWFRDVTDQIQGIEIFEKQTKSLRLIEEYALIKDEMERADEYIEALRKEDFDHRESQRQQEDALRKEENDQKVKLISIIAGILGFAGLWATTLAVPNDKEWFDLIMLSDLSIIISSLAVIFSMVYYFLNRKN